jgi:nicotinate-nucleotide pyrophosphorylase (carboxylating)
VKHDIPPTALARAIDAALAEDVALGDLTARLLVDPDQAGAAEALAKQDLVLAGIEVFAETFRRFDPAVAVEALVEDGTKIPAGTVVARVSSASTRGDVAPPDGR